MGFEKINKNKFEEGLCAIKNDPVDNCEWISSSSMSNHITLSVSFSYDLTVTPHAIFSTPRSRLSVNMVKVGIIESSETHKWHAI